MVARQCLPLGEGGFKSGHTCSDLKTDEGLTCTDYRYISVFTLPVFPHPPLRGTFPQGKAQPDKWKVDKMRGGCLTRQPPQVHFHSPFGATVPTTNQLLLFAGKTGTYLNQMEI